MQIAEFFVNLGIKGSEKALGAVSGVAKGMKGLWSSSTEAKVAIVGAFYELEQLFAASNQAGTSLKQFETLTGMSAQMLQEYNYAAQQAVGHSVDLSDTFHSLQDNIKGMLGAKGGPGFEMLSSMVKALKNAGIKTSMDEVKDWVTNTDLLVQRMQKFALLPEKGKGSVARVWKEYILSGITGDKNLISSLLLGGLTNDKVKAAKPFTYSDQEVDQLTKASTAWANMATHMELAVGHFNAVHGVKMAQDLEKVVDALVHLVDALVELSDQLKVFKALSNVLTIAAGTEDKLAYLSGNRAPDLVKRMAEDAKKQRNRDILSSFGPGVTPETVAKAYNVPLSQVLTLLKSKEAKAMDIRVNTNVYTSSNDPKGHGDIVGNHVAKAMTQTPTLAKVN